MDEFISSLDTVPDFACLTEHWYTVNETDCINLEDYHIISVYARHIMVHGGSVILARNCIEAEEIGNVVDMSIEGHIECASLVSRPSKLVILCIYRPPNGDEKIFLATLSDILNLIFNKFKKYNYILCGDFNINLLDDSLKSRDFKDLLAAFDLTQHIFEPTRITTTSATLIDNFFC